MRNLKIGIMGTRGIPNHYGGFEQFAAQLSVSLFQRGHDVSVYNSNLHPYKEKVWNGVKIIHCADLEHRMGTAGQFIYDLNCINDARKRDFDILLHLGYTSDSVWYWRWPKQTINIVNMDGLEWQRSKYNKLTQRFLKWAESLAARNADSMIADSPDIQRHLLTNYGKKIAYIPYGAEPFSEANAAVLSKYNLLPHQYFLLIARMEPENNIEMIINGHLASRHGCPLFIVGNITNKFGRYITEKYSRPAIQFSDAIYDQDELDNLRFYSSIYFHGHSVGGTNPSLLEAMACGCRIVAHDNRFNRAVLQDEADYFLNFNNINEIIKAPVSGATIEKRRRLNMDKIRMIYHPEKIADAYEDLMLDTCGIKKMLIQPAAATAV